MIEPKYLTLRDLFSNRVFRIPEYQRFYSWRTKQRNDLFEDIERLVDRSADDHHFMATVVCYRTQETTTDGMAEYRLYDVVDGQQRLTTLIILLKCVFLDDSMTEEDRKELGKVLVKQDSNLVLLQSNNANQQIFNQFLRSGKYPSDDDIVTAADRNLANAIKDCEKFVQKWKAGSRTLIDLVRVVQNRLGFVAYDTENAQLVYNLFEILNSRGLAVDWLDKCKSLLMGAAHELAESDDAASAAVGSLHAIWGNIYRKLAEVSVPGQEILRVTATLRHGPSKGKPQSAEDSLELLRNECIEYTKPEEISNHLFDVASKLVDLEKNVMLDSVTRILHSRILAVAIQSSAVLDDAQRARALKQWECVTFRIFGIEGKDSRTKVGQYVRLSDTIMRAKEGGSTYAEIMASLRDLGSDFPIETAVENGLLEVAMYDWPEESRYILWRYEEHLAAQAGKGSTIDPQERYKIWKLNASDSLEHIFPQNPKQNGPWKGKMKRTGGRSQPVEDHVHRIGNLLLLPTPLNSEASRKSFEEKKQLYTRHHLRQIDEVTKLNDWTLDTIEARENDIIEFVKKEWADLDD